MLEVVALKQGSWQYRALAGGNKSSSRVGSLALARMPAKEGPSQTVSSPLLSPAPGKGFPTRVPRAGHFCSHGAEGTPDAAFILRAGQREVGADAQCPLPLP